MSEQPITSKPIHHRKRVQWFIFILAAIALASVVAWWFLFRSSVSTNDARIATNIVRIVPVGVGGQIVAVNVDEGSLVTQGQLLAEIDHRQLESQYHRAQAKYDLAKLDLQRAEKVYDQNGVALKDVDMLKANFRIAEAELNLTKVSLDNSYLRSPLNGIVIQRVAQLGNNLEPGQVAFAISDVDHAWVNANIEETAIGRVKVGQHVAITIDEGGILTGHVDEVLATTASQFSLIPAENAAGNFTKLVQRIPVKIALDPHPGRVLRVGQSVTIRIHVR
jgi:membrane fusion protein (multidrug efflux system)